MVGCRLPAKVRSDRMATDVIWHGHSTTSITMGEAEFLTDPVFRSRIMHLRRHSGTPDLSPEDGQRAVLISHLHFDHLDIPSLRAIGTDVPILVAPGGGRFLSRKGFRNVTELVPGERIDLFGSSVRAVEAVHGGGRSPIHGKHVPVGFVVEGERRVYFAGDTDIFEGMSEQAGGVDLALLPVWGWGRKLGPGHLDPERAARALDLIRPSVAIPIHWGTFFPVGLKRMAGHHLVSPPKEFQRLAGDYAPETEVRVIEPGSGTSIS